MRVLAPQPVQASRMSRQPYLYCPRPAAYGTAFAARRQARGRSSRFPSAVGLRLIFFRNENLAMLISIYPIDAFTDRLFGRFAVTFEA